MEIRRRISRNIRNFHGIKVPGRIVVIESDDWGSQRMPSLISYNKLKQKGIDLDSRDAERYNKNDSLASATDLSMLFELLTGFKDSDGNPGVFTPCSIVANPDFKKIRESGFNEYHFELFTETLKKTHGSDESFKLWKGGIQSRVFLPQFHGREHLNVCSWLSALKQADNQTMEAFNEGVWGFVPKGYSLNRIDYQAAFLLSDPNELNFHRDIIKEGLDIFEKLFGYRAEYFVPPNGPFNNELNTVLFQNGIKYRSAPKIQNETLGNGKTRKVYHWLGQKDKSKITYIIRNCFFEPSLQNKDWVDSCLNDINMAFKWHRPAVISTHRVNYVGSLNAGNRSHGLSKLKDLLASILRNWPEVKFMTTPELGRILG